MVIHNSATGIYSLINFSNDKVHIL